MAIEWKFIARKINYKQQGGALVKHYTGWWFFTTPLKNDGVRPLGSLSQYMEK